MGRRNKYGFTLVELLVVIAIIGILAAALTTQVSRAREIARAMRCKTNLKNLAQAALGYATEGGYMPSAGSYEVRGDPEQVGTRYVRRYAEQKGWVGWTGNGRWPATTPQNLVMNDAVAYGTAAYTSITNGVLWSRVGQDLSVYVCESHRAAWRRTKSVEMSRSYVMNSYFGYQNNGQGSRMSTDRKIKFQDLLAGGNAANLLLFAEFPPMENNAGFSESLTVDSVLQSMIRGYSGTEDKQEILGFYHQIGKRYVSHVSFADGHVAVLIMPQGGAVSDLKDLTEQLGNGDEVESELRAKMR